MRSLILVLIVAILVTACGPATNRPQERSPLTSDQPVPLSNPQLRTALEQLPGLVLAPGDPLRASYPVGALFAEAALLPLPGGVATLDPLAMLLRQSTHTWRLTVRAATGEGLEYDRQLAAERTRVLQTYFKNAGVDLRRLTFLSLAEAGDPLELTLGK